MNRRQFVESQGATCDNWGWSWSFIRESDRTILFGAWDVHIEGNRVMILSDDWQTSETGRKNPGYDKSLEHIRRVVEDGYHLMIFPMIQGRWPSGKVKIKSIVPRLSPKKVYQEGDAWYATDPDEPIIEPLAEELSKLDNFFEGAKTTVTINAYERNPKARAACIVHHGCKCAACGFDFVKTYGPIGEGFIHVHHIKPIGQVGARYQVDPVNDLIPVCPNCHAMIHLAKPHLTIQQLRNYLRS